MKILCLKTLVTAALVMSIHAAQAGPIEALICRENNDIGKFVILFADAVPSERLSAVTLRYRVRIGHSDGTSVYNVRDYVSDTKDQLFPSEREAYQFMHSESVVIPLHVHGQIESVVVVESAKKRITIDDPSQEKVLVLDCLRN